MEGNGINARSDCSVLQKHRRQPPPPPPHKITATSNDQSQTSPDTERTNNSFVKTDIEPSPMPPHNVTAVDVGQPSPEVASSRSQLPLPPPSTCSNVDDAPTTDPDNEEEPTTGADSDHQQQGVKHRRKYGRLKRINLDAEKLAALEVEEAIMRSKYATQLTSTSSSLLPLRDSFVTTDGLSIASSLDPAQQRHSRCSSVSWSDNKKLFVSSNGARGSASLTSSGADVSHRILPPHHKSLVVRIGKRKRGKNVAPIPTAAGSMGSSDDHVEAGGGGSRSFPRDRCAHYLKQFLAAAFSTIGLLCLMVGYAILGGYVFSRLEAPHEETVKADMRHALRWHVDVLWTKTIELNVLYPENWTALAERLFDNYTREVYLATKNKGYDGGGEGAEPRWNYAGALLYSVTVITTIGYGHIAPKTPYGMTVTMLYAIVGIPLTLLAITNLGRMLATAFRFLYKNVCCVLCCLCCCSCCRRRRRRLRMAPSSPTETLPLGVRCASADKSTTDVEAAVATEGMVSGVVPPGVAAGLSIAVFARWRQRRPAVTFITDVEEIQKVSVPISVSLALIAGYIALGSLLFSLCEGWDYLVASYFCFVTLSTIGFGDYVPGTSLDASASQEKMVLCAFYLVFGLAVLAMCFDLMQEEARNKFRSLGRRLGLIEDQ